MSVLIAIHCFKVRLFSPTTQVSYINKTDLDDIAEILLKVTLDNITIFKSNLNPKTSITKYLLIKICLSMYHIILLSPTLFYYSDSTKPGKWAVMYLYVWLSIWPFSTILIFDVGTVPTVWHFIVIHFIISWTLRRHSCQFQSLSIGKWWFL